MSKKSLFYFAYGGLLLLTSAIAFLYFTLFGYDATLVQWLSAFILFVIGAIMMALSEAYHDN